jgi:creatinine amidohydrolase
MTYVSMRTLTWPQAKELAGQDAIGLIPTGSLEQHGPHLPLATDSIFATALAEAAAERIVEPVVVPPLFLAGLSDHHLAFPGTVSLSRETFGAVLTAYLDGFGRIGITRAGIISGHGGNFTFIGELGRSYTAEHPGTTVVGYDGLQPFIEAMFEAGASKGIVAPETDVHAGALETSMALALFEEAVGDFEDAPGYTAAEEGWRERLWAEGIHSLTPSGVLGLPRGATAEAGAVIMDRLAGVIAGWLADELGVTLRAG